MKKLTIVALGAVLLFSCKNENQKPEIVGTNENGEELYVNEEGDTLVYKPTEKAENPKSEKSNQREFAFNANEEGAYEFMFNLKKGETYPFQISTQSRTSQTDGNQSLVVNQESTTRLEYTVTEVKDSTYVMDVTYKRFSEKMSNGKETISFDTDAEAPTNEGAKQRWDFNKAMLGKSFTMEISQKGKVVNIANLWKVREEIKNAMDSTLNDQEMQQLDAYLKSALSDEAMQSMFEESVQYYPKKATKLGETWDKSEKVEQGKSELIYKLDSVTADQVMISIDGTSSGSSSDSNAQGIKKFVSLEGSVNGKVYIDKTSGWVKNAEMQRDEVIRETYQFKGQKQNLSSTTKSTTKIN